MGKPFDDPPTEEEMKNKVEEFFGNKYEYSPIEFKDKNGDILFFQSKPYPIQIELEPNNGWGGEEIERITSRVYETPPKNDGLDRELNHHLHGIYPDSYEKQIGRMLMSISGCMNGGIKRNNIEKR